MKPYLVIILAFVQLLPACGYKFASHDPPTRVALEIVNDSAEPGMPLVLRRGLVSSGEKPGILFVDPDRRDVPLLEVTIEKMGWNLVGTKVISGEEGKDVGASVWEGHLQVQARLFDVEGRQVAERTMSSSDSYLETGLASATEERRQIILLRLVGPMSDLLTALIVTKLPADGTE